MKYIVGSLIISFGLIFVVIVILMALQIKAPGDILKYLALSWPLLAIATYPLAKKLVR